MTEDSARRYGYLPLLWLTAALRQRTRYPQVRWARREHLVAPR